MTLRVVGAGLGRTGTLSLKLALTRLLGAPCYHMMEVTPRDDFAWWTDASLGRPVDWKKKLEGFAATVDWPGAAFWEDISAAFPDALILLSTRRNAEEWWASACATIFDRDRAAAMPADSPFRKMMMALMENRFTAQFRDAATAMRAYDDHNAHVRATAPRGRLVEWKPGDGWAPLAAALHLPIPREPFPHVNTTEEFRNRAPGSPRPGS